LTLLVVGIFSGCKKETITGDPIDTFEGGKLFKSSSASFYIAELHGTFHEMGRQYGQLLKVQLGEYYKEVIDDFLIGEVGVKYDDMAIYGRDYYNQFPQIFKEYFDGITETSGMNADQIKILSSGLMLIYLSGCSSLSAWGDYTPDHSVVVGRNLDLGSANLRRFGKYFHVVVWNPTGYNNPVRK